MICHILKGRVRNLVFAHFLYLCTNSNNFWHVYSMYKIKKIPQTTFFDFAVLRFSAVFGGFPAVSADTMGLKRLPLFPT